MTTHAAQPGAGGVEVWSRLRFPFGCTEVEEGVASSKPGTSISAGHHPEPGSTQPHGAVGETYGHHSRPRALRAKGSRVTNKRHTRTDHSRVRAGLSAARKHVR